MFDEPPKQEATKQELLAIESSENVHVQHFLQSAGLCGPSSLRILLSYFGKTFSEEELAKLAQATMEQGTEHEGMVSTVKELNGFVYVKENGTIEELEYFVKKEKLPVIIGWFDEDGDHYSVVVNVTDKNIIICDPQKCEPTRWLDRTIFPRIWFDFIGKDNKIVSWGWFMVVTFQKKKFEVKGGHYY